MRDLRGCYPDDLFHIQRFDLLDERVDFFRRQLAAKLWHVAFAVGNDRVQVIGSGGMDFLVGNKRRPVHKAALGIVSVTADAVFLKDRIRGQGCVGRQGLSGGCGNEKQSYSEWECFQWDLLEMDVQKYNVPGISLRCQRFVKN